MSKNIKKNDDLSPVGVGQVEYNLYWGLESQVASSFNRLKAKLFNLIEATITQGTQQSAVKGLIKGFANDEYNNCIEGMRGNAKEAKYISPEEDTRDFMPRSEEPLENRDY